MKIRWMHFFFNTPIRGIYLSLYHQIHDFFCSLPTFEDFEVVKAEIHESLEALPDTGGDVSFVNNEHPSNPDKTHLLGKYEFPANTSDGAQNSEAPSRPNEKQQQPMDPELKPPPLSVGKRPNKRPSNYKLKKGNGINKDDLDKPPFKFPLKDYTQEVLGQTYSKFGVKNNQSPTGEPYNFTDAIKDEKNIENSVKNQIKEIIKEENKKGINSQFYNLTIAEFFKNMNKKEGTSSGQHKKKPDERLQTASEEDETSVEDLVIKVTIAG